MTTVEVTIVRAMKVWWCVVWRAILMGFFIGVGIAIVDVFVLTPLGLGPNVGRGFGGDSTIASIPLMIFIGIWATRMALTKHYLDFSIALVKRQPKDAHESESAEHDETQAPPPAPA